MLFTCFPDINLTANCESSHLSHIVQARNSIVSIVHNSSSTALLLAILNGGHNITVFKEFVSRYGRPVIPYDYQWSLGNGLIRCNRKKAQKEKYIFITWTIYRKYRWAIYLATTLAKTSVFTNNQPNFSWERLTKLFDERYTLIFQRCNAPEERLTLVIKFIALKSVASFQSNEQHSLEAALLKMIQNY